MAKGKLIIFKCDEGELSRYRSLTGTKVGDGFYRIANAGAVKSLIDTIAEHLCYSSKPLPEVGYRLTETVPGTDSFRDNGWEVVATETYTASEGEFEAVHICRCAYKPLPENEQWVKESKRLPVSVDSFGGDQEAFDRHLESQKEPANV